jgi:hypothetical protein
MGATGPGPAAGALRHVGGSPPGCPTSNRPKQKLKEQERMEREASDLFEGEGVEEVDEADYQRRHPAHGDGEKDDEGGDGAGQDEGEEEEVEEEGGGPWGLDVEALVGAGGKAAKGMGNAGVEGGGGRGEVRPAKRERRNRKRCGASEREERVQHHEGIVARAKDKPREGETWKDVYWSYCAKDPPGKMDDERVSTDKTWKLLEHLDSEREEAARKREATTESLPPSVRGMR